MSYFIDKNISWVNFNERVLEKCNDSDIPLYEKFNFLGISESNLSEFLSVKYAEAYYKNKAKTKDPDEQGFANYKSRFNELNKRIKKMKSTQNLYYRNLISELKYSTGLELKVYLRIPDDKKSLCTKYFNTHIKSALTPVLQATNKELPFFKDNEINLFISMKNDDNKTNSYCFLTIPKSLQRLIKIAKHEYVHIEDIILNNIHTIFKNKNIDNIIIFKVNKEYTAEIDHVNTSKFIVDRMKDVLRKRDYSPCIFLDVLFTSYEKEKNESLLKKLMKILSVPKNNFYVHTNGIGYDFLKSVSFPNTYKKSFKYESITPKYTKHNFFDELRNGDILVHHPYESYQSVIDFIREAAYDDKVVVIRQTLYRVSSDASPIINALCDAALSGKQVYVLLEILARFDETQNIGLIHKLKEAGVNILYSLEDYKTHCKMCLVTRNENKGLVQYAHVGTGNYNEKTALIYTDLSLFTMNQNICNYLSEVFNFLSGNCKLNPDNDTVFISPFNLRSKLLDEIDVAILYKKEHPNENVTITIKVNNASDNEILTQLIKAAENNVKVKLITRGIFTIDQSVAIDKNIEYHCIIGRFLEHSRIYMFTKGDNITTFISSADLLPRNLDKRIELLIKILDKSVNERLIKILDCILADDVNLSANTNVPIAIFPKHNSHNELFNI